MADKIANGITLNGFKFMTIKAESDEVVGRKGVSRLLFWLGSEKGYMLILLGEGCILDGYYTSYTCC